MSNNMQADLVAALAAIQNPPLSGTANYGKYATLAGCLETVRRTLTLHNLAVLQMTRTDPDRLVTRIIHTSGEHIEDGGVPLLCENKTNPQKMGSAITYARRYGLCAMLAICGEEDDDGQRATPQAELPKRQQARIKPPAQVSDDIPFPGDVLKTDWSSWVDEQIAGMSKHRTTAEHKRWSTIIKDDREKLERENLELHGKLLAAYVVQKNSLENRS